MKILARLHDIERQQYKGNTRVFRTKAFQLPPLYCVLEAFVTSVPSV